MHAPQHGEGGRFNSPFGIDRQNFDYGIFSECTIAKARSQIRMYKGNCKIIWAAVNRNGKKWLLIVVPCAGANAIYFIPLLSILLFHFAHILWILLILCTSVCVTHEWLIDTDHRSNYFRFFWFIYSYLCAEFLIVSISADVRVERNHQMHDGISIWKQRIAK